MSITSKVLTAAAALMLFSGVGAAGVLSAGPASAETSSCGGYPCIDAFSLQFGTHKNPGGLVDVYQQGNRVGQRIILFRTSNRDPAEDFTITDIDPFNGQPPTVAVLNTLDSGLFSKAVVVRYGSDLVYENEYAPFGVDSGLCMGLASAPFNGEGVTLQACGYTARTLWIVDKRPGQDFNHGYVPLINGADTNFTNPYVLTYPANGVPTDLPRPQLTVHTLQTYSKGYPYVFTDQLWGADFGVLS